MSPLRLLKLLLLASVGAFAWQSAQASDLPDGVIVDDSGAVLPAVSGFNGKWEFSPGILYGSPGFKAGASFSAPLGDRFGLQGDGMLVYNGGGLTYGAGLHAFTRDPSQYLLGVTSAFVKTPGATIGAVGVEAELYLDNISLEGWAGWAGLNYVDPMILDKTGVFAIGDIAYYATPDLRFSVGASYVLGDTALRLGTEYQFTGLGVPLSLTGEARIHSNGAYTLTIGLKGYFGGNDPDKSLIDRHRQDDPHNKGLDLFTAAGNQLDPAVACIAQPTDGEHIWVWDTGTMSCDNEAVT